MTTPNAGSDGKDGAGSAKPEDKPDHVSFESWTKLLDQKKAQDAKLKEAADKLAKYEADEKAKADAQLLAEKRHEEIIANQKAEIEKLTNSFGQVKVEIANSLKRQALEREIGGFAHPDYASFAKLDSIELLEDGSVDATSVGNEAKRLRESHPHLLKQVQPTQLPNGTPDNAFNKKPAGANEVSWGDALKDHFKD